MICQTSVMILKSSSYDKIQGSKDSFSSLSRFEGIVLRCAEVLRCMSECSTEWRNSDSTKYNNTLLINLMKIFHQFESDGSSVAAGQSILLFNDLFELSAGSGFCLKSAITPILAAGELHMLSSSMCSLEGLSYTDVACNVEHLFHQMEDAMLADDGSKQSSVRNMRLMAELHANSSIVQSMMMTMNFDVLPSFISQVSTTLGRWKGSNVLGSFDNFSPSKSRTSTAHLWLSSLSWISSCHLALYFGLVRIGNFVSAWYSIRFCGDISKTAIAYMRASEGEFPSMDAIRSIWFLPSYLCSIGFKTSFTSRFYRSLEYIARIYLKIGDARKAKSYIIALAESSKLIRREAMLSRNPSLHQVTALMNETCYNIRHLQVRTATTDIFSLTMPSEERDEQFSQILRILSCESTAFHAPFLSNDEWSISTSHLDWLREAVNYILLFRERSVIMADLEDVLDMDILGCITTYTRSLMEHASLNRHHMIIRNQNRSIDSKIEKLNSNFYQQTKSFGTTLCNAGLLIAKSVMSAKTVDEDDGAAEVMLNHITCAQFASSECRAESFYILGLRYLQDPKESGELRRLWEGPSSLDLKPASPFSNSSLTKAREMFSKAASFAGPASLLLSRQIQRLWALTLGPEDGADNGILAGELVHATIGSSARQTVYRSYASIDDSDQSYRTLFEAFDFPFSDKLARGEALAYMYDLGQKVIPPEWKFVAMTLCPTGEILISSLQLCSEENSNVTYRTICVFPDVLEEFPQLLRSFDDLMEQSRRQLSGIDSAVADEKFNNSKATKQAWWDERYDLDHELEDFLEALDTRCCKNSCFQDNDSTDVSNVSSSNLAARFEAACSLEDNVLHNATNQAPSKTRLKNLTVVKLKERLKELGLSGKEMRSLRKADLVDLLHDKLTSFRQETATVSNSTDVEVQRSQSPVTFLILDESLGRLPFEGVPTLKGKTICRIPSLPFAIASLRRLENHNQSGLPLVDPSKTTYVLDPECNLLATQDRILSVLSDISTQKKWEWNGTVGITPSNKFMKDALTEKKGLYLYFGHGAGERFFSRTNVEELANECQSSIVLMGCSSGNLISVNSPKNSDVSEAQMYFEPDGAALSYLCAGAPCVVSNLWDVTDRDIDRFSISLLEGIFQDQRTNVAQNVSIARNACKLKYIVGCAPIVYGVPVAVGCDSFVMDEIVQ